MSEQPDDQARGELGEGERPVPAQKAPPRDALREVYVELLAIEQARLAEAVRIESERKIVFPETTVIAKDVRYLAERVHGVVDASGLAGAPRDGATSAADGNDGDAAAEVETLLAELAREASAGDGGAR